MDNYPNRPEYEQNELQEAITLVEKAFANDPNLPQLLDKLLAEARKSLNAFEPMMAAEFYGTMTGLTLLLIFFLLFFYNAIVGRTPENAIVIEQIMLAGNIIGAMILTLIVLPFAVKMFKYVRANHQVNNNYIDKTRLEEAWFATGYDNEGYHNEFKLIRYLIDATTRSEDIQFERFAQAFLEYLPRLHPKVRKNLAVAVYKSLINFDETEEGITNSKRMEKILRVTRFVLKNNRLVSEPNWAWYEELKKKALDVRISNLTVESGTEGTIEIIEEQKNRLES